MQNNFQNNYITSNTKRYRILSHLCFFVFISLFYFVKANNSLTYFFVIGLEILLVTLTAVMYDRYNARDRFVFSPMFLWLFLWCCPIILARVYLPSMYYGLSGPWDDRTIMYVTFNTICFYVVFSVFSSTKFVFKTKEYIFDYERLSKLVIGLLLIGIVGYSINAIIVGYIPLLTGDADSVKSQFISATFFYKFNIISRISYVFLIPCIKNTNNRIRKKELIVLGTVGGILLTLTGFRQDLFQIVVYMLSSIRANKKVNYKYLRLTVLFVFLAFAIIAVIRDGGKATSLSGMLKTGFRYVYLYIYPNFTNFKNVMNSVTPIYGFVYTSEMFWGIFFSSKQIIGDANLYKGMGTFNVGTYLLQPYADFGIIGTLFWTSLISYIAIKSYRKVSQKETLIGMALLGISYEIIYTMHNGFLLRNTSTLIYIFIAVVFSYLCRQNIDR